ncbi:hypothetical protein RND81_11G231900 [Saponaria officinalis]|uniref:H15 domain-containing protein n=1 Tax=Saponaria officinalis TaxID=3572 RepID=A0AAW1HPU5_SAPOF
MSSTPAEVQAEPPPPSPAALEPHAPPEVPETAVDAPSEQPQVNAVVEKDEKKKQRTPREKKRKTPAHPPYFEMIKEAITALNEKGGSSPYAIAKYMEQNHKHVLPANFRKILGPQLKNSVAKGKLIKIKASFKLSEVVKKSSATKTRAARANAAEKPKEATKKRKKRKSREVSKIENPPAPLPVVPTLGASTRGRRSKRSAPPPKPKQLKSIKLQVAKKAKKVVTA